MKEMVVVLKVYMKILSYVALMLASVSYSEIFASDQACQVKEFCLEDAKGKLCGKMMGQGTPIIVIHGGAGYLTHDYMLPAMEQLANKHTTIFYDQRGLGRSTSQLTPEYINVAAYVEDLESIRQHLGFSKISLLGHSWGGFIAMHYAIAYPEAVDKMVLLSSMPASSEEFFLFLDEINRRLEPYRDQLAALESSPLFAKGDSSTYADYLQTIFQTYMYRPEQISKLNLHLPQDAIVNGLKVWEIFKVQILQPYNLFSALANVRAPTLIIQGDADPIPFESAEHLYQALSCSQLFKIKQCGHFPFIEQPALFFEKLEAFLQSN